MHPVDHEEFEEAMECHREKEQEANGDPLTAVSLSHEGGIGPRSESSFSFGFSSISSGRFQTS